MGKFGTNAILYIQCKTFIAKGASCLGGSMLNQVSIDDIVYNDKGKFKGEVDYAKCLIREAASF